MRTAVHRREERGVGMDERGLLVGDQRAGAVAAVFDPAAGDVHRVHALARGGADGADRDAVDVRVERDDRLDERVGARLGVLALVDAMDAPPLDLQPRGLGDVEAAARSPAASRRARSEWSSSSVAVATRVAAKWVICSPNAAQGPADDALAS